MHYRFITLNHNTRNNSENKVLQPMGLFLIKGLVIFFLIYWFIHIPVCGPKAADIIFALDASESLTAADFEIEKEFVYNFTKQFKIGRDNVQFGAITIADHPHPDFYLNTYHDRRHLLDKIQSLVFLQSGTNTADTLKIIHDEMFKGGHGGRHSASRIVVVLTDGMSKDTNRTREEAHNLQKVATVHAIGIGSLVNNEELAAIDSNRKPGSVTGFDVLHTMGDYLMEIACPGTHTGIAWWLEYWPRRYRRSSSQFSDLSRRVFTSKSWLFPLWIWVERTELGDLNILVTAGPGHILFITFVAKPFISFFWMFNISCVNANNFK